MKAFISHRDMDILSNRTFISKRNLKCCIALECCYKDMWENYYLF